VPSTGRFSTRPRGRRSATDATSLAGFGPSISSVSCLSAAGCGRPATTKAGASMRASRHGPASRFSSRVHFDRSRGRAPSSGPDDGGRRRIDDRCLRHTGGARSVRSRLYRGRSGGRLHDPERGDAPWCVGGIWPCVWVGTRHVGCRRRAHARRGCEVDTTRSAGGVQRSRDRTAAESDLPTKEPHSEAFGRQRRVVRPTDQNTKRPVTTGGLVAASR
jgi:hypothetical protein